MTVAVIMKITYGYSIQPIDPDPLVELMDQTVYNMSIAAVLLSVLFDIIPGLNALPDGFLGMRFKEIAQRCRKLSQAATNIPIHLSRNKWHLTPTVHP